MKVGEQRANDAELETGRDEDFRHARVRLQRGASGLESAMLQGADHGSAHSNNAAAFKLGAIDGVRSCG